MNSPESPWRPISHLTCRLSPSVLVAFSSSMFLSVFATKPTPFTSHDLLTSGEWKFPFSWSRPSSSIILFAFLQLVKWQTVENFSYFAISLKLGFSPWKHARSISVELGNGFGSQQWLIAASVFLWSSAVVGSFNNLRFSTLKERNTK